MYLIIGLGNPGIIYAGSRHNLGFQVIEALSHRLQTAVPSHQCRSLAVSASHGDRRLILAQPLTYMNRSGQAVAALFDYYRIEAGNLLIIYDDLDLPPGIIRLRSRGGSGGHRGVQSVIDALGINEFPRLRIGIGRPPEKLDAAEYVLLPPSASDSEQLEAARERAADAVLFFVDHGLEAAMNFFNG